MQPADHKPQKAAPSLLFIMGCCLFAFLIHAGSDWARGKKPFRVVLADNLLALGVTFAIFIIFFTIRGALRRRRSAPDDTLSATADAEGSEG